MRIMRRFKTAKRRDPVWIVVVAIVALVGIASCTLPYRSTRHTMANLDSGWPKGHVSWSEALPSAYRTSRAPARQFWTPRSYEASKVSIPQIAGADLVGEDTFCATCHETYATAFANNVHAELACEKCHGAASRHVASRGLEPDTILSFLAPDVKAETGMSMSAPERSEVCLQCHEKCDPNDKTPCLPGSTWRTSSHAHRGIACTDCHRNHYLVPLGTPAVDDVTATDPDGKTHSIKLAHQEESFIEPGPQGMSRNLNAIPPDICYKCHGDMRRFENVDHPHQMGVVFNFRCTSCHDPAPSGLPRHVEHHPQQFTCTTCHDVHGNVRAETRKDLCLKCHDGAHMDEWHASPHDQAGVACTDCHNPHPLTGLPMTVNEPVVCYRCHSDMRRLEAIAHPHQILGPNGFNCTTCHNPHSKVVETTRKDLCLQCHDGAPTMAWHSSTHNREGVACADCHNPHPNTQVQRIVAISYSNVRRPKRLPMSVDEPAVCYGCHPKIYALSNLPSHHPIREGKMVCSDCHDAHGQAAGHLAEDSVNAVCYNCHAEKEGPFAYEHAPVTENCGYCHEPHGTVANNLLHQPTTFLCLRCHSGHSTHDRSKQCTRCHIPPSMNKNIGAGPLDPMTPTTQALRRGLFTDCTQCHTQVHGSDVPAGFAHGRTFMR